MTCKDCIHEKVCENLIESGLPYINDSEMFPAEEYCLHFMHKGKFPYRQVVICSNCKKLRLYNDGVHSHQCMLYGIRFKHYEINDNYCSHGESNDNPELI